MLRFYDGGTVTTMASGGQKSVLGSGTLWLSNEIRPGFAFRQVDADGKAVTPWQEVAEVLSDTELVLKDTFQGTGGAGQTYQLVDVASNDIMPSFVGSVVETFRGAISDREDLPLLDGVGIYANGRVWKPAFLNMASSFDPDNAKLPISGKAAHAVSFTPKLVGATTAGTFTYDATTTGMIVKIGDLAFYDAYIKITGVTASPIGALSIEGLPDPCNGVSFPVSVDTASGDDMAKAVKAVLVTDSIALKNSAGAAVEGVAETTAEADEINLPVTGEGEPPEFIIKVSGWYFWTVAAE